MKEKLLQFAGIEKYLGGANNHMTNPIFLLERLKKTLTIS